MRNLLTLLMLFAAAATQAAIAPTVLVFGDSLSAGYGIDVDQSWPALLQVRLESQGYEHRVINASISGETTEGGATRIASTLENFSPDLVILELGGNDGQLRTTLYQCVRKRISGTGRTVGCSLD
jgi:acyl-CoA thioesterase-1